MSSEICTGDSAAAMGGLSPTFDVVTLRACVNLRLSGIFNIPQPSPFAAKAKDTGVYMP